ncbi:MAG: hypothetical protein R2911_06835 [Caldilineaceae bacterium]
MGQAYRVTATPGAPNLADLSISMNYLGRYMSDPKKEELLTIYYWDTNPALSEEAQRWQPLESKVDQDHNVVTSKTAGTGVYMLMYSFDVTASGGGWSQFSYPVLGSRPITAALSYIDYHMVYLNEGDSWLVFAPQPVPDGSIRCMNWSLAKSIGSAPHTPARLQLSLRMKGLL